MSKILIAYADWMHNDDRKKANTHGGIGYYRQVKPAEQIQGHEVKVVGREIMAYGDSLESQWDMVFKKHDVFWTSYFANGEAAAAMFFMRDRHDKKVIIDIDDNYLDIPESNLIYDKFKKGQKDRAFLSAILSLADALTVSTEPLKARLQAHIKQVHGIDKPIYVIPNYNDVNDWKYKKTKPAKDKFVIGYAGSNSHQDDLRMVMPAIANVMKRRPEVYFELIGAIGRDKVKEYFAFAGFDNDTLNRVSLKPATTTFNDFPRYLSEQPWNVGICPLVDTPFTRSKSHIKWMEYSMYEIPVLASRVYPYYMDIGGKDTIRDGETGFLVKPKDWEATLEEFIENYEQTKVVGVNARAQVLKEWQYKDSDIGQVVNEMLKDIDV